MLESCRWRGYVPAGETCALGSLFTARSYLAAVAESESMKQELHTTHYTIALGASHRPVLIHHTTTVNPQLKTVSPPNINIDDILGGLAGGDKFSKLDLANAYNQMEVSE